MYDHCDAIVRATRRSGHKAIISRGVVSFSPEMAEEKIKEAIDVYEAYNDTGRIKVFFAPHAQYTNDNATIAKIGELAKKYNTGIHTHVSETKKEHEDCIAKTGKTPIKLFKDLGLLDVPFIGAHCVHISEEDMEIMKQYDATVATCVRSNLKLASGIAPVQKMLNAGINVGIGTDSAASNNRLSMLSELSMTSLIQKAVEGDPTAIPAQVAIRLATSKGAKALKINGGVVQEGMCADLIMVSTSGIHFSPDYDPVASIVYASEDKDIVMTMVSGDIIYEDGKCMFADVLEVKERLEFYAKEISR